MDYKLKLLRLLGEAIQKKGLKENPEYVNRLRLEIKQINIQDEHKYFIDLYRKGYKFKENENNLLVPYLLDIVSDFDISIEPKWIQGEFPDIDIDYIKEIQPYLKNEWAPKTFGEDCVCNIGNYATFGLKGALQDMARVHGLPHDEIEKITTKLEDSDSDGKPLTLESALDMSPELKEYYDKYPEVCETASKLVGRVRSRGKHAGGLIIAKSRLDELVPLVVGKDGNLLSAWAEGQATQDLAPVGLVKFDVLVVTNLEQISKGVNYVRQRHGIDRISAVPGGEDWSDTSYLEDPKAIAMADTGQLKCIFQFDSPGMREMVKKCGVDGFNDLVALTALFRPGPLGKKMDQAYIDRKNDKEDYDIPDLIKDELGYTYGVMVYQEQVMQVLNKVGNIPKSHCEKVRKAISKKKHKIFAKYKEMFIENGQINLGWTKEAVQDLWDQVVSFSAYGFNKSHAVAYTYISSRLLFLKAHYPLEFFAAVLSCEKDSNKIKEYKLEAENFNIDIHPIDLNKSNVHFDIRDNQIYIGFADIKGIGLGSAEKIVEHQPYSGFDDFIDRFGTDAKVLKPLIALGVFKDIDKLKAFEFLNFHKKTMQARVARDSRFEGRREKLWEELKSLHENLEAENIDELYDIYISMKGKNIDLNYMKLIREKYGFPDAELATDVMIKYVKSKNNNLEKRSKDETLRIQDFISKQEPDPDLKEICDLPKSAIENMFYGFPWDYMIRKSSDYRGLTFDRFDVKVEQEGIASAPIEVQVIAKPKQFKTKKGGFLYKVWLEDGNGRRENITIWEEDFDRFKEEFNYWDDRCKWGNLLKLRIKAPVGTWKNYTFWSPPKYLRDSQIPAEKEDDHRLMVMNWPDEIQELIDSDIAKDFEIV
jgi:DNA polymerase III alpha subunit